MGRVEILENFILDVNDERKLIEEIGVIPPLEEDLKALRKISGKHPQLNLARTKKVIIHARASLDPERN